MSQIHNNTNVPDVNLQQGPNVQNAQPRADLPPEMQNARPANRGIRARIGAFLFGAGAAGGAFGAAYVGALGVSSIVAGIATGGVALIGGAVGLGLFVGIRALVNHFRRAPDPEPRLQNQPQNHLPQAQPEADASNNAVADAITGEGKALLPVSLQQAADNAVSRLRDIYGETLMPQGATLSALMDGRERHLANEIRALGDNVTPAKMEELVEKYMRQSMARAALAKALQPFCREDDILTMRNNVAAKHPELLENLRAANSPETVRNLLAGAADEFKAMAQLNENVKELFPGTVAKMVSIIARSLGLDAGVVTPFVSTHACEGQMSKLRENIVQGKVDANTVAQEFSNLAEKMAKPYVDAFAAVDAAPNLNDATKTALKMAILTSPDKLDPEIFRNGIAAGQNIDVRPLKIALDRGMPKDAVLSILTMLGENINVELQKLYSPEARAALLNGKPGDLRATQGAAFLAMLDKEPGLKEALLQRQDLDVDGEMKKILLSGASTTMKGGAMVANLGYMRLRDASLDMQNFAAMQAQTQSLHAIRNADIPEELKTRWSEKVMNGAIAEPAMIQALIENVPRLSGETRPLMERYILLQSYAPGDAEASAQKARAFAQEIAGWRNFNTAEDPAMAPVTDLIREDITGSLVGNQQYDRGISDQMKRDAHRGVYTINGEVLNYSDADEVARSLRRAMPTENAAKLVSSIVNQRSFGPVNGLSMQMNPTTSEPLPENVLAAMTKMASRNFVQNGLLHFDLSSRHEANVEYKVLVANGRAHIEMSEDVGLDSGLGSDANGAVRLAGKARYTLHFECDLLGNDGQSPSIASVHLEQQLLPIE